MLNNKLINILILIMFLMCACGQGSSEEETISRIKEKALVSAHYSGTITSPKGEKYEILGGEIFEIGERKFPMMFVAYNKKLVTIFDSKERDKIKKILQINIDNYNEACFKILSGENENAIKLLNKILEDNPKINLAYYYRGLAYYYKGNFKKALDDVNKAQELGYKVSKKFYEELHNRVKG